ncbi:phosphoglycerate mutase family protein [uncultured Erythrobacter sp.]|uniref:SixA phosphatase family protein n=1 Tax=uncultured Erythrobacter sp. TaxID=263913 RepID=UPI00261A7477|nr:phosphoglycerate mutase family protein [uncultured Erythrobacter sp.]
MTNWRGIALLLALALGACMAPAQPERGAVGVSAPDEQTVYVIRHLQKAQGDDPVLTSEGAANAQVLASILEDANITGIYSTPTRRTMQTGAPLAGRIGVEITPYDPRNPDALVAAVRAGDGSVLVVGHSNTVGDLITRFGGNAAPELTEQDYGTLFVVAADGTVSEIEVE